MDRNRSNLRRRVSSVEELVVPSNGIATSTRLQDTVQELASKFTSRGPLYTVILLMMLPAGLLLLYITAYGVNVVYMDKWAMVPIFDKLYTGDSSILADLWRQTGAGDTHRIFFPRITMLLFGDMTDWNSVGDMCLHLFFSCLTSYVLLRAYIRTSGSAVLALAKFIPVVWIIFWLRPYEIIIGGGDVGLGMSHLFLVLALYLLVTSGSLGWRFALSVISSVVASYSFGSGLLVWPIGLVLIILARRLQMGELKRLYLKMASIWCLIGIFVFVGYYADYTSRERLLSFIHEPPLYLCKFYLAYIGAPLSRDLNTAVVIGSLLLLLFICVGIYALSRRPSPQSSMQLFFLSLMLFALLSGALLIVSRSHFGIATAIQGKYTAIAAFGIIGLYLLMLSLKVRYKHVKPFLLGALLILVVVGLYGSFSHAIGFGKETRDSLNKVAYYVSTYELQSAENLREVFFNPWVVVGWAPILEKYNLNVFSKPRLEPEKLTLVEGSTLSSIDFVNDRQLPQLDTPIIINAQDKKTITISGWAVDQKAGRAAGGVFVNVDGQIDIPALYGSDRPDVADLFKNSRYRYSGFWASFATSRLSEGQHTLSLKIVTADKKGYYKADQKIILEVK